MNELIIDAGPGRIRKNILKLAWPAILRLFLQSIVGVVDVIMIGKLGSSAIAAVDMGNRLVFVLLGSLMSMTIGATALVAHHIGAGHRHKANHILWQALLSGFFAALILAVFGAIFSKDLLRFMLVFMENTDQFILNEGSVYLKIVFMSMVFGLPTMVINSILQGTGNMRTPLFIMLVTNVINVLFNYFLIFGIGFFPELGVAGAAWGTALGRLAGFLVGMVVITRGVSDVKLFWKEITLKIDWEIIKGIVRIGFPASIEQFVRQGSNIIYTALVAGLGTATIAANAISMNVISLSFMPGFGFGMAATTLVGQSLGARKGGLAEKYAKQSTYMTVILMALASVLMYIFVFPITQLYTEDMEVARMASTALKIFVIYQPLLAIFMVMAGALRGAGDTKWVMYFTIIGNWGIRLIFTLLFAFYFNLGLNGFWIAMGVDILIRSGLILMRFKSGKWKENEVLGRRKKIAEVVESTKV